MFEVVKLPEKEMIDQWDNLEKPPIVETVPRSVPLPTFVKYPSEKNFQHILSGRFKLFAQESEEYIDLVNNTIEQIESLLSSLYTRRGVTKPLHSYIEMVKKQRGIQLTPEEFRTEQASNSAKEVLKPILRLLKHQESTCVAISVQIKAFFICTDFWKEGRYNDDFIDRLCVLFLRATSLEQLGPDKNCLINDLAHLKKIINDPKVTTEIGVIQMWFTNPRSLSSMILKELSDVKPEDTMIIFDAIFNHIKKNTNRPNFIDPEIQFAYNVTFIFIIQFYEQTRLKEIADCSKSKKLKPKMKELGKSIHEFYEYLVGVYPLTPLFFEIAQATNNNIPNSFFGKAGPKKINSREVSLPTNEQLKKLRHQFNELSGLIGFLKSSDDQTKEKLYDKAPDVTNLLQDILHTVASTLNSIRTFLISKLVQPPPATEDNEMGNFERSMKIGLSHDLDMFLLLLRICRTLRELIEDNLPLLQECVWAHVMNRVQLFVYDNLREIMNSSKKDNFNQTIATLRAVVGNFTNEAFKYDEKHDKKKQPPRPPKPTSTMNSGTLELLRHKLQAMVNPESPIITKAKLLNSNQIKDINAFLEMSRHYSELMQLNETIDIVFDQSNLYFKEYYLSVYDVSFFPITTSLPVILCDHALRNNHRTDLTSAIFYPLSIYDDAASKALRFLHSKYLYEEIKAEASICLLSVSNMISDSIFNPLRIFASLRSMNINSYRRIKNQIADNTHALRMGVILQQNQLFVLGCFIDTKSLLSDRLNDIFYEQLTIASRNLEKYGVLASIAYSKLVQMLHNTHELLLNFDLPLMSFNDILSRSLRNDTPNSLQSKMMFDVLEHIEAHISDFYAVSFPLSLVPRYLNDPKIEVSGKQSIQLDAVMQKYLGNTLMLMTTENFRELFKFMENGTIAILHQQILNVMYDSFESLSEVYPSVREKLKRIGLGNSALNSNQIYDRFEGAYNYFHDDSEVLSILTDLTAIGNVLVISEMMDNAFLLKKETMLQNQAFLFAHECVSGYFSDEEEYRLDGSSAQGKERSNRMLNPEFFEMFDNEFKKTKPILYKDLGNGGIIPKHSDRVPIFLYNALNRLNELINQSGIFTENSKDILDPKTMDGFSSVWTIVEFLFCLIEMLKDNIAQNENHNPGSLGVFGESPLFAAAAIILLTGQKNLYNVHDIGKKIKDAAETELSFTDSGNVGKFCKVFKVIDSSIRCAFTNYQSITDAIVSPR